MGCLMGFLPTIVLTPVKMVISLIKSIVTLIFKLLGLPFKLLGRKRPPAAGGEGS